MTSTALEGVLPGSVLTSFQPNDLAELVVLQRCCWVPEAIANHTFDVPALHETPDDVTEVVLFTGGRSRRNIRTYERAN